MAAAKVFSFAIAAALTSVFFLNFCALVFQCGCASLWNGAAERCNIHLHGVRHCPWCSYGMAASIAPYVIVVAAQAVISFWPRPISVVLRLLAAAAAFPVVGAVVAVAYRWATGY